jgi:hypothetical protein
MELGLSLLGRSFMRLVATSFCCLAFVSLAFAQSDRSTITGTIADQTGAVVANAPIEARNLATGLVYTAASTATGNYTISELPVGTYEVTVAVSGFKKYVRSGLDLAAAQTYRIDVGLQLGASSEQVTVTESAPLLKTESGELGHSVTGANLDALPVLGIGSSQASNSGIRDPYAATMLLPGANFTGDVTVQMNGLPQNTESFRVEGQESSNATMTAFGSQNQPSVDSIQEFQIQTSNYSAEYGQAGGGVFIATMKSGTNLLHGSAYDYFVNEALNADTPFVNTKPRARRNDYGFTFGGPVRIPKVYNGRNKTFFFYNFEQFRESEVVNNVPDTVPTAAYRGGNFATAIIQKTLGTDPLGNPIIEGEIYDPASNFTAPNGKVVRTPFLNNAIPTNRFDPVALAIQNLIPLPAGPNANGLINNYLPAYNSIRHTDINSIKVDQMLSAKSKLSVFYSRTHTFSPYSQAVQGDGLPPEITDGRGNYDWVHTTRINYDYTITPTLLLHIGVGYVNQHGPNDYTPALDSFNPATIGLKGTFVTGRFPNITGLLSAVSTGGMQTIGPATSGGAPGSLVSEGIYSFRPTGNTSLTWIRGNHTFKAGTELIVNNFMYKQDYPGEGAFVFGPGETSEPYLAPATTLAGGYPGFAYASFLLGAVDNGNIGVATDPHFRDTSIALFIQDSWKVTHKFTLDYGLRWDHQQYLRETDGREPSFSEKALNANAGNLPGGTIYEAPQSCNCNFGKNYPLAFGPRLGAAYQITPKTVFRAGFGIVYAKTATYDNYTLASNNPFVSPGSFTPAMYLQNGIQIPVNPWPYFNPSQFPNVPGQIGTAPSLVDPNAGRPPRQIQWSVGIQREIMRDLVVEASYVGNRGAWWPANGFAVYNAVTPAILAAHGLSLNNPANVALLGDTMTNPQVIQAGFTVPYASFPSSSTLAQALRPFPQFGNISGMYAPLGDTWYNALQAKATKRFSHGLEGTYSLAWQKSLTMDSASEGSGGGAINDAFNRPVNKDLSQFDQPLVSIIALSYTTPKWQANLGAASKPISWLTRDWVVGALLSYRSGLPIESPLSTNNLATATFQSTFANRVAGVNPFLTNLNCNCFNPATTLVLNSAAWTQPAAGQFGTAAAYYTDYRQERRPSENMNVGRTFRIRERANLNVRAEFTNVFNRTVMNAPSSTNSTTAPLLTNGTYTGGFGYINTTSAGGLSRQGMLVARFTF